MPDRASFVCGPTATIRSVLVPLIDRGFIPHAKAIREGKTPAMLREYQHRVPSVNGSRLHIRRPRESHPGPGFALLHLGGQS